MERTKGKAQAVCVFAHSSLGGRGASNFHFYRAFQSRFQRSKISMYESRRGMYGRRPCYDTGWVDQYSLMYISCGSPISGSMQQTYTRHAAHRS